MDRPETISLLRSAHDEVIMLRRQIDDLGPKAHAYDTIAAIARLKEPRSQGMSEDVAWRLKQAVETLVAEREAEKAGVEAQS